MRSRQSTYNFLDKIIRTIRLRKVLPLIPEDCEILDLGCGYPPHLLLKVERKIKFGVGIEKDMGTHDITSKIKVVGCDLDQGALPFQGNSFDVVTAMAVIEHLEEPIAFLKEVKRVLRDKGLLIITSPTPLSKSLLEFLAFQLKIISQEEIKDHKHYFSKKELLNTLKGLGFQKTKHHYFEIGFNHLCLATKK